MSEKNREVVFEDILNMNCRSVQKVLRESDFYYLARAIKTAKTDIQNKFFNAMSERTAELIKGDMESINQISDEEVEEAREKIVVIIKNLEDTEEIYIDRETDDKTEPSVEINGQPFVFEDIIILDNHSIQRFLKEVDSQDLVMALKNADVNIQEKIFVNVSRRAASMIKEDIEYIDIPSKKELRIAKNKLISIIKQLESAGKIVVDRTRDYSNDIESAKIEIRKYEKEMFDNGGTLIEKQMTRDEFLTSYLAFKKTAIEFLNKKKKLEEDDLFLNDINDDVDKEKVKALDIFHYGISLGEYADRDFMKRIFSTIIKQDSNEYSRKLKYIQMEAVFCIRENESLENMLAVLNSYIGLSLKDEECNNTQNNNKEPMSRDEFYTSYLSLKDTAQTFAEIFYETTLRLKKEHESSELDEYDYSNIKKSLFQSFEKELDLDKVDKRDILHYGIYLIINGIKLENLITILTNLADHETDDYSHRLKIIQREMVLSILSGKGKYGIEKVLRDIFDYTRHYKGK